MRAFEFMRLNPDVIEMILSNCVESENNKPKGEDVNITTARERMKKNKQENSAFLKNTDFRKATEERLVEGGDKRDFRRALKQTGEKGGSDLVGVLCDVFDTVTENGWDKEKRRSVWADLLLAAGVTTDGSEVCIGHCTGGGIATHLRLVSKGMQVMLPFSFCAVVSVDYEDMHTNCGSTISRLAAARSLQNRENRFVREIDAKKGAASPFRDVDMQLKRGRLVALGAEHAKNQTKNATVRMMQLADKLPVICRAELSINITTTKIACIRIGNWAYKQPHTTRKRASILCSSRQVPSDTSKEMWSGDMGFGIGYDYGASRMEFDSLKCNNADYEMCTRISTARRISNNKRKRV